MSTPTPAEQSAAGKELQTAPSGASLKSDGLLLRTPSASVLEKGKELRKKLYDLAKELETLGTSRELSLAFTNLELALVYVEKHLALTDAAATKETW